MVHACTTHAHAWTTRAPHVQYAWATHAPRVDHGCTTCVHRLTQSPRALQARLARLRKARLVVLPVNDNPDSERSGGGHWSCLAFRRLADTGALDRAGVSPGQGRGQPWSGPGSALVRAGTSHG